MSNIQTVTLEGAELKTEGLGGQNAVIVNRGASAVYASAYPGIVPDADNVAVIPPGGAMNLRDTRGTVYLLGTGKVQLTGTDNSWLPVSGGASGGGGGGTGDVTKAYVDERDAAALRSAKEYTDRSLTSSEIGEILDSVYGMGSEMPYMSGIVGYFTPETLDVENGVWKNTQPFSNIALNGVAKHENAAFFDGVNSSGVFEFSEAMPVIVYAVAENLASGTQTTERFFIDRGIGPITLGVGLMLLSTDNGGWLISASAEANSSVITPGAGAHVLTVSQDIQNRKLHGYCDGSSFASLSNPSAANAKDNYKGMIGINCVYRNGKWEAPNGGTLNVKFLAFGIVSHTEEQIKANSDWLKKKYLGG